MFARGFGGFTFVDAHPQQTSTANAKLAPLRIPNHPLTFSRLWAPAELPRPFGHAQPDPDGFPVAQNAALWTRAELCQFSSNTCCERPPPSPPARCIS